MEFGSNLKLDRSKFTIFLRVKKINYSSAQKVQTLIMLFPVIDDLFLFKIIVNTLLYSIISTVHKYYLSML